jgi:hypothetical protein
VSADFLSRGKKRVRFRLKDKRSATYEVTFDFVKGETTQKEQLDPARSYYWLELLVDAADLPTVERVLRDNGSTKLEVTDV